jgi:hypothetical protein
MNPTTMTRAELDSRVLDVLSNHTHVCDPDDVFRVIRIEGATPAAVQQSICRIYIAGFDVHDDLLPPGAMAVRLAADRLADAVRVLAAIDPVDNDRPEASPDEWVPDSVRSREVWEARDALDYYFAAIRRPDLRQGPARHTDVSAGAGGPHG